MIKQKRRFLIVFLIFFLLHTLGRYSFALHRQDPAYRHIWCTRSTATRPFTMFEIYFLLFLPSIQLEYFLHNINGNNLWKKCLIILLPHEAKKGKILKKGSRKRVHERRATEWRSIYWSCAWQFFSQLTCTCCWRQYIVDPLFDRSSSARWHGAFYNVFKGFDFLVFLGFEQNLKILKQNRALIPEHIFAPTWAHTPREPKLPLSMQTFRFTHISTQKTRVTCV